MEQWKSILYVNDLRPDPSVKFFFSGFCNINQLNPNEGWREDEWSAERANRVFKETMGIHD